MKIPLRRSDRDRGHRGNLNIRALFIITTILENDMNSVREWLETLMQIPNEQGGPEMLRKELSATIEDVLVIHP